MCVAAASTRPAPRSYTRSSARPHSASSAQHRAGEPAKTEGSTMTQHVVATPSPGVPLWRRRSFLVVVGVVVLALGVGAAVRAIVATDSTTASHASHAASASAEPVTFDG